MKKLNNYLLIILSLLILSLAIIYFKKEESGFVEINENIEYQTYKEKKSINMGGINKVSELKIINRINEEELNILHELFEDEKFGVSYRVHNINKASRKQLKFIGFSNKKINKILKYRENKDIENLIELKDIIGDFDIKGGIIFSGDDI